MRVREGQQKFPRLSFPEGQANLVSTGVWSVVRGVVVEGDKRTYPRTGQDQEPGGSVPLRLRFGGGARGSGREGHGMRITRERRERRQRAAGRSRGRGRAGGQRPSSKREWTGERFSTEKEGPTRPHQDSNAIHGVDGRLSSWTSERRAFRGGLVRVCDLAA